MSALSQLQLMFLFQCMSVETVKPRYSKTFCAIRLGASERVIKEKHFLFVGNVSKHRIVIVYPDVPFMRPQFYFLQGYWSLAAEMGD